MFGADLYLLQKGGDNLQREVKVFTVAVRIFVALRAVRSVWGIKFEYTIYNKFFLVDDVPGKFFQRYLEHTQTLWNPFKHSKTFGYFFELSTNS